jgi:uroporphyrinogen III methyltransferase/synthase
MSAGAMTAQPLAGRVIVVTRAKEQAGSFRALLEQAGARVLLAPTIVIEPPATWAPLDESLARLADYQWVIFTSVNGVEMVRRRLEGVGRASDVLRGARIAAIGPATTAALRSWGLSADVVPETYVAEGLVEALRPLIAPGVRVLLPRAAQTRDVLVHALRDMGALVDEVPAYRARAATEGATELQGALRRGEVDVVTFTSSSTVRHFAALFGQEERGAVMSGVTVACIGPITRATAAAFGIETRVMPSEYTIPALARAIVAHFDTKRG